MPEFLEHALRRDETMASWLLLISVTVLYSGYNLLIKVSASHVPEAATTTIQTTICLQLAAPGDLARILFVLSNPCRTGAPTDLGSLRLGGGGGFLYRCGGNCLFLFVWQDHIRPVDGG